VISKPGEWHCLDLISACPTAAAQKNGGEADRKDNGLAVDKPAFPPLTGIAGHKTGIWEIEISFDAALLDFRYN
jgi:hypothetical protein